MFGNSLKKHFQGPEVEETPMCSLLSKFYLSSHSVLCSCAIINLVLRLANWRCFIYSEFFNQKNKVQESMFIHFGLWSACDIVADEQGFAELLLSDLSLWLCQTHFLQIQIWWWASSILQCHFIFCCQSNATGYFLFLIARSRSASFFFHPKLLNGLMTKLQIVD